MRSYRDLIGTPYKVDGRSKKEGFDCYGLVHYLHKENGIKIPDYKAPEDACGITALILGESVRWKPTELKEGAVLVFKLMGHTHVGYASDENTFVHAWEQTGGVTIERISRWKYKIIGVYKWQ